MTITDTEELAPGVHRIETIEDGKLHGYHVLEAPGGPVLVDPGYVDAPTTVYQPFLEDQGWGLDDVSLALVTHADADHFGGNHELRSHNPTVPIAAHVADLPLVESVDRIMDERYSMFEADHGITYDGDTIEWIMGMMGPDEPVTVGLRGGETLRVRDRLLEVLHTPGHTKGHLMLYDRANDLVIGADGFFGRGLFGVDSEYLQPPPYYLYPEYETTTALVESLDPDVLCFTHYDVMYDGEIDDFVAETLDFVHEVESLARDIVASEGPVSLSEAIDRVVEKRGSFGLDLDLAFPLSAHFRDLEDRGVIERVRRDNDIVAWRPAE
jgi:glyoxylase-like metal-dependent hydrolase (beta-lactamase superfamily II)